MAQVKNFNPNKKEEVKVTPIKPKEVKVTTPKSNVIIKPSSVKQTTSNTTIKNMSVPTTYTKATDTIKTEIPKVNTPTQKTDSGIKIIKPSDAVIPNMGNKYYDTELPIIKEYESLPTYNAFDRLKNAIKGSVNKGWTDNTYARKQELYPQYKQAKIDYTSKLLNRGGITLNDVKTARGDFDYSNQLSIEEFQKRMLEAQKKIEASGVSIDDLDNWWNETEGAKQYDKYLEDLSEDMPVISSLSDIIVKPIFATANTAINADQYLSGNPIEQTIDTNELRNKITDDMSGVGSFAYNTAMSVGDMLWAKALGRGGAGGAALMGAEKADDTVANAVERGLNPNQIMGEAVASGLTTAITEKISFGKMEEIANSPLTKVSAKEIFKRIIASAIPEGAQEMTEDIADNLADRLIAQDKSEKNLAINNYMAQGMTEKEAKTKAFWDSVSEIALDGLGGAISGGLFGGIGLANNYAQNGVQRNALPSNEATQNLNVELPTTQNNAQTIPSADLPTTQNVEQTLPNGDLPTTQNVEQELPNVDLPEMNQDVSDEAMKLMADRRANEQENVDNMRFDAENAFVDIVANANYDSQLAQERALNKAISMAQSLTVMSSESDPNIQMDAKEDFDNAYSSLKRLLKNNNNDVNLALAEMKKVADNVYSESMRLSGKTTDGKNIVLNKFYTNTLPRSGVMTDVEQAQYTNPSDFTHVQANMEEALTIADDFALNEKPNTVNSLLNKKDFGYQDTANSMSMVNKCMEDGRIEEAVSLLKKISKESSKSAQNMRMLQEYSKDTVAGAYADVLHAINEKVDEKHFSGYSYTIDNVVDEVKKAIYSAKTVEEAVTNVKGLLNMNLQFFGADDVRYQNKRLSRKSQTEILNRLESMMRDLQNNKNTSNNEKTISEDLSDLAKEAEKAIREVENVSKMTDADHAKVLELIKQAEAIGDTNSREYAKLMNEAAKIVDRSLPETLSNKVKTTLYNNMLASVKTIFTRNFGGNAINATLDVATRPFSVGIDKVVSKITGKHAYDFSKGNFKEYMTNFMKAFGTQTKDVTSGVKTLRSGESGFNKWLDAVHSEYKKNTLASKFFRGYDNTIKTMMQYGDRVFYEGAYAYRKNELQSIVDKYGADKLAVSVGLPKEFSQNIDDAIEFMARESALEACLQNNSITAKGLSAIKRGISDISRGLFGADILTQTTMPFVQVGANNLERTLQYTPIGLPANTIRTIIEAKGGNFDQARFSKELGRNLTGLLAIWLTSQLFKNGLISGGYSDDSDEKKAQQAQGYIEYGIQLPDGTQMSLDDTGALSALVESGARFSDAIANGSTIGDALSNTSTEMLKNVIDQSALQGISNILPQDTIYASDGKSELPLYLAQTASNYAGQLVPGIVRNTADFTDPYKRYLGDYNTADYAFNSLLNQIPIARETLLPKLDNEGQEVLNHQGRDGLRKFLESYILPYNISKPEYSDLTQEAMRLKDVLSENGYEGAINFVPTVSKSDVTGLKGYDKQNYSTYDKYELSDIAGDYKKEFGEALINSEIYKSMTPEEQNEWLGNIYSSAKAAAKVEFSKDGKANYEAKDKGANAFLSGGVPALLDYVAEKTEENSVKAKIEESGAKVSKATKTIVESGNDEMLPIYAELQNNFMNEHGKLDTAKSLDYLTSNNIPKVESGELFYTINGGADGGKQMNRAFDSFGYEGVYDYYYFKSNGDTNGNGTLTKEELTNIMKALKYSDSEIENYWNKVFKTQK